MSRISLILLVAASVLVAVLQCCYASDKFSIPVDYLVLPKSDELENNKYHQEVREAMVKLNLGEIEEIDSDDIVQRIKDTERESSQEFKPHYKSLKQLFEEYSPIPPSLIALLKSVVAQTEHRRLNDKLAQFKVALMRTGSLGKLIDEAKQLSPEQLLEDPRTKVLTSFDKAFSEALVVEREKLSSEELKLKLVEQLKKFDLATDNLDAKKMVGAAGSIKSKLIHSNGRVFIDFMNKKCGELEKQGHYFDIINLARGLGYYMIRDPSVARLNEYHRICLAWKDADKQEKIIDNVMDRLVKVNGCGMLSCFKN